MTLVLIGKDLVLEGSTTKIKDKQVPGIYCFTLKASKSRKSKRHCPKLPRFFLGEVTFCQIPTRWGPYQFVSKVITPLIGVITPVVHV